MTSDEELPSSCGRTLAELFLAHRHASQQTERWIREAARARRQDRIAEAEAAEREAELAMSTQLILEERIRALL
jgi:hypothetical protein